MLRALLRKVVPERFHRFLIRLIGGFFMRTWLATFAFQGRGLVTDLTKKISAVDALLCISTVAALAQPSAEAAGGEASLKLRDLSQGSFLNGAINGLNLLLIGILFCLFGLGFGMVIYMRLKNLPDRKSTRLNSSHF